jgi:hypothetical protein
MHRSARRDPLALMIAAMLLGAVAGTSVGLLQGAGPGPTAAPAQAATAAPPSSPHAAAAAPVASSASQSSGGTVEQRLSAPRRQLDRGAKAGKSKPKQKEPGDSGKQGHAKGKDKGKQAHDH